MANSADPDQLASLEANWSGSTLFAKEGISGFSRTRVKQCNLSDWRERKIMLFNSRWILTYL